MKRVWIILLSGLIIAAMIGVYAQGQMKMQDLRSKSVKQAAATLAKAKKAAIAKGQYGCCLKHPCDQCFLHMGACPCGGNAASGKPVCQECKGSWMAGDGAIGGKKAEDIKVMPRGKM